MTDWETRGTGKKMNFEAKMKIYRTGKVLYNLYLVYVMRARVVYITEKKTIREIFQLVV